MSNLDAKKYKIFLVFFLLTLFFVLPKNTTAANLHHLSDKMNRHAPGVLANHQIWFTTPTGIGESGQYLRIIFDNGFDLSNLSANDIELSHGPVTGLEIAEIVSLSATETAWGADIYDNIIDLYHPLNNNNGDIAPNDIITIKIGLNTSLGVNQIKNPIYVGSKIIAIAGNFGDSGKLAVPIFLDRISIGNIDFNDDEDIFEQIGDVTCNEGDCAYFSEEVLLSGNRPENTTVYINGSSVGVTYPSEISWEYLATLSPGENQFVIYAMDSNGTVSNYLIIDVSFNELGDTNGDNIVDDFDLSTLVAHFGESWCFSDFNGDNIVDDFDLSILASNWSYIY